MSEEGRAVLLDLSGAEVAEVTTVDNEVVFPSDAYSWTWVMDARHGVYAEMDEKTLLHRAEHARKRFVLVTRSA
jgi:hypothetical protein